MSQLASPIPIPGARGMGLFSAPSVNRGDAAGAPTSRSPIIADLPTFDEPLVCGFSEIEVPTATDCSAAAAWYGLLDVKIRDTYGQEVGLFKVETELCSPDLVGVEDVYLPWGTDDPGGGFGSGVGVYIVIGTNLPTRGRPAQWVTAGCPLPGANATGTPLMMSVGRSPYILQRSFPTGSFGAADQVKSRLPSSFAPFIKRLSLDDSLQVALVVRGNRIVNPGTAQYIRGFAMISMWLGNTVNGQTFGTRVG